METTTKTIEVNVDEVKNAYNKLDSVAVWIILIGWIMLILGGVALLAMQLEFITNNRERLFVMLIIVSIGLALAAFGYGIGYSIGQMQEVKGIGEDILEEE